MSKVYQFNFEKTYKEIEINGKMFHLETNDEAQAKYRKSYKEFMDKSKELKDSTPDLDTASEEEVQAYDTAQRELTAHVIETFLGDGTFDEIYVMAGKSLINLRPLMDYITEMILEDLNLEDKKAVSKKYMSNGKK